MENEMKPKEPAYDSDCTHNCMTCGKGCGEGGVGLFEKALNGLSEIDADELLKGIQSLGETEP